MTTTRRPRLGPLLRQQLVELCQSLDHSGNLHHALVDEVVADCDAPCRLLAASLYALYLRPGLGDIVAERVRAVASAQTDVENGYRSGCDCCHPTPACSHAIGCDACDAHWQAALDGALDEFEYALGDRALADLAKVTA